MNTVECVRYFNEHSFYKDTK